MRVRLYNCAIATCGYGSAEVSAAISASSSLSIAFLLVILIDIEADWVLPDNIRVCCLWRNINRSSWARLNFWRIKKAWLKLWNFARSLDATASFEESANSRIPLARASICKSCSVELFWTNFWTKRRSYIVRSDEKMRICERTQRELKLLIFFNDNYGHVAIVFPRAILQFSRDR